LDLASCWEMLRQGRGGIRTIKSFDPSGLPVRFAGEIAGFDAKNYVEKKDRKNLRMMARSIQLAVAGAQLALTDSAIDKEKIDPTRFGVEFGASLIASELEEMGTAAQVSANGRPGSVDLAKWGQQGIPNIQPLWMLKYLPNMLACHISIMHNAQGPNNTITECDVAGLLALGEAFRILGRDQADLFLVGGAESRINPLGMARQCLFQPLSRRNEEPAKALRPFDRLRDGMVLGEGAGVFILEDLAHAQKRGARIYVELVASGRHSTEARQGPGWPAPFKPPSPRPAADRRISTISTPRAMELLKGTPGRRGGCSWCSAIVARRFPCSRPRAISAAWERAAPARSWWPACWLSSTASCRLP
jgi:3-oxoacyl-[acyl-carrier-protein] synthase II